VPILEDIAYSPTFGYAQWDMSDTGTVVYRMSPGAGRFVAAWIDGAGHVEPLAIAPGAYEWPRVSPAGTLVSLSAIESGVPVTLIHQPGTEGVTRLAGAGAYRFPTWSVDGRTLVLGGPRGLATLAADGRGDAVPLLRSDRLQIAWSLSADGQWLAYHELSSVSAFDLWIAAVRRDGAGLVAGPPEPFLATPAIEVYPAFSPDGRWIAYASNESGGWEIYVREFPGGTLNVKVSEGGGRVPRWAPGGREIFYSTEDHRLMTAAYELGPEGFTVRRPRQWWQGRLGDTGVLPGFDVGPGGERVLALLPAMRPDEREPAQARVMVNFLEELRRRAEARRD
jgi:serine/threonine-protein kinase